jgi:hypothetical protein
VLLLPGGALALAFLPAVWDDRAGAPAGTVRDGGGRAGDGSSRTVPCLAVVVVAVDDNQVACRPSWTPAVSSRGPISLPIGWVDEVPEALADQFGVGLPRFALSQGRLHYSPPAPAPAPGPGGPAARRPGPDESRTVIRRVRSALTATAGKRPV